jgi:hypothetical protein
MAQGNLYTIGENSQVPIPLLTDYFRGWISSQPDINNMTQLIEYVENKEGVKEIGVEKQWMQGLVKSDINRPFLLILNNNWYVGVHILKKEYLDGYAGNYANKEERELFRKHEIISTRLRNLSLRAGANSSYQYDDNWEGDFLNQANTLITNNPLTYETIKRVVRDGNINWGVMVYSIPQMEAWLRTDEGYEAHNLLKRSQIQHYELNSGQVCWGGEGKQVAYYLDEVMDLGMSKMSNVYLNWLGNPMSKNIQIYHEMVRQEKKRIADLKRRNKVENELITHMDYDYKKMIRFHNQLKGVITGKCADGLYFNTSKINYLLHKFRSGDLSKSRTRNQNMPLVQIMQHMGQFSSISNRGNHNSWPGLHIFMKDLFGKNYNLKISNDGENPGNFDEIYNWTTWPMTRSMNMRWFQQIMISGMDLSYYLIGMESESYKSLYGTMELAEDSLVLKFNKEGGPLDKSKYYSNIKRDIYENLKSQSVNDVICVVPKWMLIKYEGGQLVDF